MKKIEYPRHEDKIVQRIKDYVDGTYSEHYAGEISVLDVWEASGISKQSYQSNIIKYAMRFGKKDGYNPKDVMKIIHYSIFLLNELEKTEKNETPSK
jgi:hypothetical protein